MYKGGLTPRSTEVRPRRRRRRRRRAAAAPRRCPIAGEGGTRILHEKARVFFFFLLKTKKPHSIH